MTPTPEQIKAAHEWCSAGEAAKEWACIDIQTQFVIYTAAAAYAAHCVAEAKDYYQSEAYQVIGVLANAAGLFEHPEVQQALDYFSGKTDEILPFVLLEGVTSTADLHRLQIDKLNRTIAALVEFIPDNVTSDKVKSAKQRVTELFAEKDAEIERLRALVRRAYNEGFSEGMKDFTTSNGGNAWFDSSARAALGQEKKP